MDIRLAVADLVNRYELSLLDEGRLRDIAALDTEPEHLRRKTLAGIGILGAVLVGLGVIFWLAANWDDLGRMGKFALIESLVLACCVGAIWRPQARIPLALIAILGIGGLFALIGQTYQSGADPWQLFAVWAVLCLPICLSVRHDATWIPFIVITMTAIELWVRVNVGFSFDRFAGGTWYYLAAFTLASLLCAALSPVLARHTGAGVWSLRAALTLTVLMVSSVAIGGMFDRHFVMSWIAFFLMGAACYHLSAPALFDVYNASILGLALNCIVFGWLIHVLFKVMDVNFFFGCLVLGLAAAGLLSLTVKEILKLSSTVAKGASHA